MKTIELKFVKELEDAIKPSSKNYIQVLIGPRQVGKTTGVKQLLSRRKEGSYRYFSADGMLSKSPEWILEKWVEAKSSDVDLLVIDEIQKVENWSDSVKSVWDSQQSDNKKMNLIVLGSSSLTIQKGLTESLAGRFRLHKVFHWSLLESVEAYGLNFEQYLIYGGYPGSYPLMSNSITWTEYIKDSIVDAVIGKDILSNARVKSPALFRQCFDIICSYPAQEVSYTKLLGQLQDKGNTDLVKYYLELFEGAFMVKQLFKYSGRKVLQRSSSPKLLPLCPALFSIGLDAELDKTERGRAFELVVGAALLRLPGRIYYWRDKNDEVDFVYEYKKSLVAIEVKSGRKKNAKGLYSFQKKFPHARLLIITPDNFKKLYNLLESDSA